LESSLPQWYFVVLPDSNPAAALAKRLPADTKRTVPHASREAVADHHLPDVIDVSPACGEHLHRQQMSWRSRRHPQPRIYA
jgi:hypothetical protein